MMKIGLWGGGFYKILRRRKDRRRRRKFRGGVLEVKKIECFSKGVVNCVK